MAAPSYPYIDIVVLDAVRERFARGEALVILTSDLDSVIWANGAGARLFGVPAVEDFLGADPRLSITEKRQMQAIGARGGKVGIRLARGFSSRLVMVDIARIFLPHGEPATLLAGPVETTGAFDIAHATVGGFESRGTHLAIIAGDGNPIGTSAHFASLDIARASLAALCDAVRREPGRLLKKHIETAHGLLPAAIARLTDRSAVHLVMVVEEMADEETVGAAAEAATLPPQPQAEPETLEPVPADAVEEPQSVPGLVELRDTPPEKTGTDHPAAESPAPGRKTGQDYDGWYFGSGKPETAQEKPSKVPETIRQTSIGSGDKPRLREAANDGQQKALVELPGERETHAAPMDVPAGQEPEPSNEAQETFAFDPQSGPVRFVWKTAPDGTFREISPEFARAVGPNAADVVGRKFADVASVFALDPTGEIAGLVGRRDTWSGRSVLWPIQGTDLKVPLDLAALPVYDRNREFDGFRGFGVARMGDTVVDPEGIGMLLATGPQSNRPAEPTGTDQVEAVAPEPSSPPPVATPKPPAGVIKPVDAQKVIDLQTRRKDRTEAELSATEASAFREIGDRLRPEGEVKPEPETAESSEVAAPAAPAPVERVSPHNELHEAKAAATKAEPTEPAPLEGEPASGFNAPPIARDGFLPSAFARGEGPGHATLDEDVLSVLPLAIVVHDGHQPEFVNDEFLRITGYRNLNALKKAGGLDVLFAEADDPLTPRFGSPVRLLTAAGDAIPVEARLHSIRWRDGVALLLSMKPVSAPAVITAPVAPDGMKPALTIVQKATAETAPLAPSAVAPIRGEALPSNAQSGEIAELTSILDTATDGVVIVEGTGRIRSLNRSAQALFGYDANEMAGAPFEDLFSSDSRGAAKDYLDGLSQNGITSVLNDGRELTAREKKGRFIPVFMTMGRLPESKGYCAVLRDITQFKRTEVELEKARKNAERASEQKSEFLARVSHEVRTPLNAIIGFSEIMLAESFGPIGNERYRDYLEDIYTSGNHVLQIINDLLDISKIEAGQQDLSYEAVPLNDIVAECISIMQPAANRERVIMRTSLSPAVPEIVADMRSIRQITLNLLSNAIRFTQAGGQIIVSTTYEKNGEVVLRVRDTGIGMSDADIEQALKPFKQVPSAKGRTDGTGLGLPLTKAMAEANRALFSIQSAPGEGTMVAVTFPSTRVLAD